MTRPQIIRADTIDLQDQDAPSAKDHTRQPTHPAPLGAGPPSPHQAGTLKKVEERSAEEKHSSPRTSQIYENGEAHELDLAAAETGLNALGNGTTNGVDHDELHHQQDDPAVRQNGGLTGSPIEDADMADAEGDDDEDGLDDDLMDKISSSPSIDDEDIDFEFVYALHTFVATVEGQANATKGDTMVLLDDSNSYWWLVRVVKDSSIGYLPAEHIETPTERLARLNKHRNIDLSATMLGDTAEKSKNPLKKAMRRRNAKTVQFSTPTYVEASDIDYTTEEDEQEGDSEDNEEDATETQDDSSQHQQQQEQTDESNSVEPLRVTRASKESTRTSADRKDSSPDKEEKAEADEDQPRTSAELLERQGETLSKSRNGTVRDTDSFFKDDTVETRKITLTPNLLRDDSSISTTRSSESKEHPKSRPSLESQEKPPTPPERTKEEKKKKEKKPGMLSGLFKRKDKKARNVEEEADDFLSGEKTSNELNRDSPVNPKASSESAREDSPSRPSSKASNQTTLTKQPSKLQKSPPMEQGATPKANGQVRSPSQTSEAPTRPAPTIDTKNTMRMVEPETESPKSANEPSSQPSKAAEPRQPRHLASPPPKPEKQDNTTKFAPIANMLKSSNTPAEPKPEKTKKAKQRVELDDFDSSSDAQGSSPEAEKPPQTVEPSSESTEYVSPADSSTNRTPQLVDSSSQDDAIGSPGSLASSPEIIERHEANETQVEDEAQDAITDSSTGTLPPWSDTNLRMYLEDDAHIRDLLVIVHDKSDVPTAPADHPVITGLFSEQNARLAEINSRLDGMLGDWFSRKTNTPSTTILSN